uniref:Hexosyltransferase n=1 Tax=Heliothis virescens TaxID=7102 RepID=A0A2A4J776_HELVI
MLSRYVVSQVKHNSYFLVGLALGLWVSLALVPLDEAPGAACEAAIDAAPVADDFEPQREERPLGPAGRAGGRSVQRPRYYSTELGMRGSLLTGVLSSEEALKSQIAALNRTTARLQPALKFFITASAMSSVPGLANVVGFTDTREMLKPFHALKYLADNYLEEYDFFFLVSDTAFVNARRLTELVSQLSVSQDIYMGTVAEDDSHYCSLEGGVLLSNSVLRAVHAELDWCVRNSYSPHHHENIGRCVLHAAHRACSPIAQGETYFSVRAPGSDTAPPLTEQLADAVTVYPVTRADTFYTLHAYVSRVHLQRDRAEVTRLRAQLWKGAAKHPPHYRNATWPSGLRADPGLAPPTPDSRFDHLRWVSFNATHAFYPDDHHEVALITGADREALDLVLESVRAWGMRRWAGAEAPRLVEGALRWEPARALWYRLLLRAGGRSRLVEVVRPLGAARLVPVRYVTESARVTILVPVPVRSQLADLRAFLNRYETICLEQDKNTALILVLMGNANETAPLDPIRAEAETLRQRHSGAQIHVLEAAGAPGISGDLPEYEALLHSGAGAFSAAATHVSRDALMLLLVPHAEFNQDFLNRVRMNTISGEQWYLPGGFARFSLYAHPRFVAPGGGKPQVNTGRFNLAARLTLSVYRSDYDSAVATWRGPTDAAPADILARAPLRAMRAPDPALVLAPRPRACATPGASTCSRALRDKEFSTLDAGARHSLAQLLLETQAELD